MLSDSPPDRDVIWTEEGVQGASRFVQRVWRLVNEVAALAAAGDDGAGLAVTKAAHRALADVERTIEGLGFNKSVAALYTLANELEAGLKAGAGRGPMTAAARMLVQMIAPMMPHLAESAWEALGGEGLVAAAPWPELDRSLLVQNEITLPVQVNGRKRADVTVAAGADNATVEDAVRGLEPVIRALEGRPVRKVIVVPGRIVNVVG